MRPCINHERFSFRPFTHNAVFERTHKDQRPRKDRYPRRGEGRRLHRQHAPACAASLLPDTAGAGPSSGRTYYSRFGAKWNTRLARLHSRTDRNGNHLASLQNANHAKPNYDWRFRHRMQRDRAFRLIAARRNVYVWILGCGFLLGALPKSYVVICGWAAFSAAVHLVRSIWICDGAVRRLVGTRS